MAIGLTALVPPRVLMAASSSGELEQKAAARALFHEGLAAADAQRWEDAADRFERARSLKASPEITYNLSTSLVRLSKLVRASELLREITDDPHAPAPVKAASRARLNEVVPRLAYLTIRVPSRSPGVADNHDDGRTKLVVLVDGQPFDEARLGVAVPMDPTAHTVHLRLGTSVLDRRELLLDEGERRTVSFEPGAGIPVSSRAWQADRVLMPEANFATKAEARRSGTWVWVVVGAAVAVGLTATTVAVAMQDPAPMQPRENNVVSTWTIGR
ncbi:MAG TPA: hypothetical protein VGG33_19325 [Polyangia bacterium]